MEIIYYNNIMIYSYLIKIKEFITRFCDSDIHYELWDNLGPI